MTKRDTLIPMKLGINGLGRIDKLSMWHHVDRKYFSELVVNIGREVGNSLHDIAHFVDRDLSYKTVRIHLHKRRAIPLLEKQNDLLSDMCKKLNLAGLVCREYETSCQLHSLITEAPVGLAACAMMVIRERYTLSEVQSVAEEHDEHFNVHHAYELSDCVFFEPLLPLSLNTKGFHYSLIFYGDGCDARYSDARAPPQKGVYIIQRAVLSFNKN